jgi:hypothetical protein
MQPPHTQSPHLVPSANGVEFTSAISVGDTVSGWATAQGLPWRFVGTPDEIGAYRRRDAASAGATGGGAQPEWPAAVWRQDCQRDNARGARRVQQAARLMHEEDTGVLPAAMPDEHCGAAVLGELQTGHLKHHNLAAPGQQVTHGQEQGDVAQGREVSPSGGQDAGDLELTEWYRVTLAAAEAPTHTLSASRTTSALDRSEKAAAQGGNSPDGLSDRGWPPP